MDREIIFQENRAGRVNVSKYGLERYCTTGLKGGGEKRHYKITTKKNKAYQPSTLRNPNG